jgi:hypothetical protein
VQRRTTLTTGITILTLALAALPAAAEEPAPAPAPFAAAAPRQPIFIVEPFTGTAGNRADAPPVAAAAQAAAAATTSPNEHQFGVGVRLDPVDNTIGASVRYFFYGGPLGVQAEIARTGLDLGPRDWTTIHFRPAVIYRFIERQFDAPISLVPYAGGGLSFIHNNFDTDDEDFFEDILDVDSTSVGVLLFGGVEIFFERVPNLGVSGELTYTSNDEIGNATFGSTSLGGVRFTAAGHWYFW